MSNRIMEKQMSDLTTKFDPQAELDALLDRTIAENTRLTAEVARLRAVIQLMQRLLAQYEAEADAPTVCEGATE